MHFLSDVFIAVASLDLKSLISRYTIIPKKKKEKRNNKVWLTVNPVIVTFKVCFRIATLKNITAS